MLSSAEGAVRDSTATPELKLPEETQTRESQTKTKNEDHDRGGEENNDWPFESGACVLSPPQTEAPRGQSLSLLRQTECPAPPGKGRAWAPGSKSGVSSKLQGWLLPRPRTLRQGDLCPHAGHCPPTPSHRYFSTTRGSPCSWHPQPGAQAVEETANPVCC